MKINLKKYRKKLLQKIRAVTPDVGFLSRNISLFEAVALISSGTIGAGVLGIPYAISQVGITLGVIYIILIGLLVTGVHLIVGKIFLRTDSELQLVGLAKHYLGKKGGWFMAVLIYFVLMGMMVVYIIGEGETLASMFGGSSFWWSIGFFGLSAYLIYVGLDTIKKAELVLTGAILSVIILIAGLSAPHINTANIEYINLAKLFFPYGVILFAFHGVTFVPEAGRLLEHDQEKFKKSIIISSIITILAYIIFGAAVVSVTGQETTQVATIGLGREIGQYMLLLGNIFAALAMGTSFLVLGLTVKDSIRIDYNLSHWLSTSLACGIPLIIFILGLRNFIAAIDLVGGIIISLEMIVILYIYWKSAQEADYCPVKYNLHHTLLIAILTIIAFSIGAVYSVIRLF
jgi:amino acid permease